MENLTILVTGSNAPGFSSIVRSLKLTKKYKLRVICSDWKESLVGKYLTEREFILPDNRSKEFPIELLKVCKKEEVDIILPIRTDDQTAIVNNLKDFEDNDIIPTIITPNPKLMDTIINKRKLLEYLRNVTDIDTLEFYEATKWEELLKAIKKLGYPKKPIAIKPAHATGSRGFRIINDNMDKRRIFFEEKPNSTFISLDELKEILGDEFPEMLIMEYLEDPEYTIDVLCYKGQTFAIVPRRRSKMLGGITSKGIVEKIPESTRKDIEKIIESLGLTYNVGLQFRKRVGSKDDYKLLEINPRLQGTTAISVAAGVNIPELMIDMALKKFDFDFKPKIKYGLKLERTYYELFEFKGTIYPLDEVNDE